MRNILALVFIGASISIFGSPVRSVVGYKHISMSNGRGEVSYSAKDYVQDGLVAMWDGIENVGWGIHDANTTTWIDLVGGRTFLLTHGVVTPNAVSVLGQMSSSKISYDTTKTYSVFHTCKFSNPTHMRANVFMLLTTSTAFSVGAYSFDANVPVRLFRAVNWKNVVTASTWPDNDIYAGQFGITYSVLKSGESPKNIVVLYLDGVEVYRLEGAASSFGYALGDSGNYYIDVSSSQLEQEVYNIRLYDRELTSDEIAANYEIDKVRFGL